jgi:predicted aspartyl protease
MLLFMLQGPALQAQEEVVFKLPEGVEKVEIPIENHNNLIVIPVIINGLVKSKFILDSGASGNVLLERLIADFLELEYSQEISVAGAGGEGIIRAYRSDSVVLSLEGIHSNPTGVIVLEQDYLLLKEFLGIEVQGIMGTSVFKDLVVEIDYENYNLILHNPEYFKPPKGFETLDIKLKNNKPYIKGEVKQYGGEWISSDFLVDLGASHALLLELDDNNPFQIPEKHLETSLGRGLSGDIEGYVGRVEQYKIGPFELQDVLTSFTPLYSKIQLHGRVGTIGGELLSRFHVLVNFQDNKLYLKKEKAFDDPFKYNMSGMDVIAFGEDYKRIVVADVLQGSPAEEAGIEPGDEILKINWIPVRFYSLSHINSILRSREEKKIRLKILRDDEKIKRKFRLKKMI